MTDDLQNIYFDSILLDMKANNPKQIYQKLSKHISNLIGTPENYFLKLLDENENYQNSGIGNGVAVIHARLPRLTRSMIVYSKISNPVNFSAADGVPVDMVALVLSPEFEGPKHLQRLAMVSRFFSNEETCAMLREATNYDSVRMTVKEMNERKKAA